MVGYFNARHRALFFALGLSQAQRPWGFLPGDDFLLNQVIRLGETLRPIAGALPFKNFLFEIAMHLQACHVGRAA